MYLCTYFYYSKMFIYLQKYLFFIYCDLFISRYVICNNISAMYNDPNFLSTCSMIWSIIKSSTNEIDTRYDSVINQVSIRMWIQNFHFLFKFELKCGK
jgi:hypothetical protein